MSRVYLQSLASPRGLIAAPDQRGAVGDGVITPGSGSGGSLSGTDDTPAFLQSLSELAAAGGGTMLLDAKSYYLDSAPSQAGFGNAVLPLPTMGYTKAQLNALGANIPFDVPTIRIVGVPGATRIICPRKDAYSAANGPMSIIGGPTVEGLGLTKTPPALPLRVELEGITFVGPDQPVGGLVDLSCVTSARIRDCRVFTTTSYQFETTGTPPANLPGIGSFAVRMPISGSMESRSRLSDCLLNGYGTLIVAGPWSFIDGCAANYCRSMLGLDDTSAFNAPVVVHGYGCSGSVYMITGWDPANGVKSLTATASSAPRIVRGLMQNYPFTSPWQLSQAFLDANGLIGGDVETYVWPTIFGYSGAPTISGRAAGLRSRPIDQGSVSGKATLAAGTVTVSNSSVTASTRVRCGILTPGGTVGAPFVSSVTAGTGFTIKSTSSSDTSQVWWEITNP